MNAQGWAKTTAEFEKVVADFFSPNPAPENFELHAHELLSPNGDGPFAGVDRERRNKFALDLLNILHVRSEAVHFFVIEKSALDKEASGNESNVYSTRTPYLIAFDYMVTAIENYTKKKLGRTVRSMMIIDEKEMFEKQIADITRYRRFENTKTHRIKWLVEFSYSIDSRKHPFVQLSDLVVFCVKKFYEVDLGYRDNWPDEAKVFFADTFKVIYDRCKQKQFIDQPGAAAKGVNGLLEKIFRKPRHGWKNHYGVN